MAKWTFAIMLLVCVARSASTAPGFGVGFSLALDYGVASVHFANGSSVDIAKIEGGPDYKEFMQSQHWIFLQEDEYVRNKNLNCHDSQLVFLRDNVATRSLRNHLPPWLGGRNTRQVQILSRLLRALKAAAEAYVETKVADVEVVFPVRAPGSLHETLDVAASQLQLNMPIHLHSPAAWLAASANGIGKRNCYSGSLPKKLVLAVDYSRAALTARLFVEECGLFDDVRALHNVSLGTENWSSERRNLLVSELHQLLQLPVITYDGSRLDQIEALVLLGERGGDERLIEALKDAVPGRVSSKGTSNGEVDMIDPLFAASAGAAYQCFAQLQEAWDFRNVAPLALRKDLR